MLIYLFLIILTTFSITKSQQSYIDFNGAGSYIEWVDDPAWGELGGLVGADYSFGFKIEENWQGNINDSFSLFSRGLLNGISLLNEPAIPMVGVSWDANGAGGLHALANPSNLVKGDSIQFNFNAYIQTATVFKNGILMDQFSMPSFGSNPHFTGVVRFGFPAVASGHQYYKGKVSNLWFSNGFHFPDGQISLELSQGQTFTAITSSHPQITSWFDLGSDPYDTVHDKIGPIPVGHYVNGAPSDYGVVATPSPTSAPKVISWFLGSGGAMGVNVGDVLVFTWVLNDGLTHNVVWENNVLPTSATSNTAGFTVSYTIPQSMQGQTFQVYCDYHSSMIITISVSANPTPSPTSSPTSAPTTSPTSSPTSAPTSSPTSSPTSAPTISPTSSPTSAPTSSPTSSPTSAPTNSPTTSHPTDNPTTSPSSSPTTSNPTQNPSISPTVPTLSPTLSPFEDVEPISINGYFPLYLTFQIANGKGFGSSHTHVFNGITYYMPDNVPNWHGDYVEPTSAPTSSPSLTPTKSPTLHANNFQYLTVNLTDVSSERCKPLADYLPSYAKVRFTLQFKLNGTDILFNNMPFLNSNDNPLSVISKVCTTYSNYNLCDVVLESTQCKKIEKNIAANGCVFANKNEEYKLQNLGINEIGNVAHNGIVVHDINNIVTNSSTYNIDQCTAPSHTAINDVSDQYRGEVKIQNLNNADWNKINPVLLNDEIVVKFKIYDGASVYSADDLQMKSVTIKIVDVSSETLIDELFFNVQDKIRFMNDVNSKYYNDGNFCRYIGLDGSCSVFYSLMGDTKHFRPDVCAYNEDEIDADYFSFSPLTWINKTITSKIRVDVTIIGKLQTCHSSDSRRMLIRARQRAPIDYVEYSTSVLLNTQSDQNKIDNYNTAIMVLLILVLISRGYSIITFEYLEWLNIYGNELWKAVILDFCFALAAVALIIVVAFTYTEIETFEKTLYLSLTLLLVGQILWVFLTITSYNLQHYTSRFISKWLAVLLGILMAVAISVYAIQLSKLPVTKDRNATIVMAVILVAFSYFYALIWNSIYVNEKQSKYEKV